MNDAACSSLFETSSACYETKKGATTVKGANEPAARKDPAFAGDDGVFNPLSGVKSHQGSSPGPL
jgi:hypothetical protein